MSLLKRLQADASQSAMVIFGPFSEDDRIRSINILAGETQGGTDFAPFGVAAFGSPVPKTDAGFASGNSLVESDVTQNGVKVVTLSNSVHIELPFDIHVDGNSAYIGVWTYGDVAGVNRSVVLDVSRRPRNLSRPLRD